MIEEVQSRLATEEATKDARHDEPFPLVEMSMSHRVTTVLTLLTQTPNSRRMRDTTHRNNSIVIVETARPTFGLQDAT